MNICVKFQQPNVKFAKSAAFTNNRIIFRHRALSVADTVGFCHFNLFMYYIIYIIHKILDRCEYFDPVHKSKI